MMQFLSTYRLYIASFAIIIVVTGCAETIVKKSAVDTPKEQYLSGMLKLTQNDLNAAEKSFMRSIELNPRSPYGHTGMAFVELHKSNHKAALKYAEKAIKYDRAFVDAYSAKGRILCDRKRGDNWLNVSLAPLKAAIRLDPVNQRALFYSAECYLIAGEYVTARQFLMDAINAEGSLSDQAKAKHELVSRIIEVEPMSAQGKRIALDDKICRADVCALLIDEFRFRSREGYHRRKYKNEAASGIVYSKIIRDIGNNSNLKEILDIVPLNLSDINVFPNDYFYPDRLMTRAQFAMAIQEVMVVVRSDETLSTKYIGSESPYIDIHPEYYAFNAIMLCSELGIVKPDSESGNFRPDDGIFAPGIQVLKEAIGSVWDTITVAPDREQSASSHALTLTRPLRLNEIDSNSFSVDGTPTDCIMLAIMGHMERKPDLVISGINYGANLGDDVIYSGTVAGAAEATILGIPSIAMSFVDADASNMKIGFEVAIKVAEAVFRHSLPEGVFLNVNIPAVQEMPLYETTCLGSRTYRDVIVKKIDPRGKPYYWIGGQENEWQGSENCDFAAIKRGNISVTPLHLDMTATHALSEIKTWNLGD